MVWQDLVSGLVLAALCLGATRFVGPRGERAWFAAGLAGAALVYVVVAPSFVDALLPAAGAIGFAAFAWFGWRNAAWFLAAGWGLHAVWDGGLMAASIDLVPDWYYVACIGFDFAVGGYFALVATGHVRAEPEHA